MLVQIFVQKVINNKSKILSHHEIIDCMAEQIDSVITHLGKYWKLWLKIYSKYSKKFTYFYIADIWTLKKEFC